MRNRSNKQSGSGPLSHLRLADLLRVGAIGLRTRKARTALTALGIAVGIASVVTVLGIASSSENAAKRDIEALGTDLLQIVPGQGITEQAEIPTDAYLSINRIGPVAEVARIVPVDATARRNELVPAIETSGISVVASDPNLLGPLRGQVVAGRFLTTDTSGLPVVVLGPTAADRLGVANLDWSLPSPTIHISGTDFTLIGITNEFPLAPELDRSAFIGMAVAQKLFDAELHPASLFVRVDSSNVIDDVRQVIPRTANPQNPGEIAVSRPTDALEAEGIIGDSLSKLVPILGLVSLLAGGIGIANVMIISVLERKGEIGVRRALGATKRHIRWQFMLESMLLSMLGGILGIAIGFAITYVMARRNDWPISLPWELATIGIGSTLVLGGLAGLYPAMRAANMDPADAVRPGN